MRKLPAVILILIFVAAESVNWALNSAWLSAQLARWEIEHLLPGARVTELSARGQHYSWPGNLAWDDVRFGVMLKGRDYHATLPHLAVSGGQTLFYDRSSLKILIKGAEVLCSPGAVKGVDAEFLASLEQRKLILLEGPVTAAAVTWDKLVAQNVSFHVSKDSGEFLFTNILVSAYGGKVTGSAHVKPEGMIFTADLLADGIDTAKLADLNDQISSQVTGRANGHVRLSGRGEELVFLESDCSMLRGAKVNAALLSALAQYIPASQEKKRLDKLIKKGGQLPVEVLAFKFSSDTPQHLRGDIKLKSREVNLELNLTNDINTDGTLMSLLDYWKQFGK